MTVADFLAWLVVTDLESSSDARLKALMHDVLDAAPEDLDPPTESLLLEIEEQVEAAKVDLLLLEEWPDRFTMLLPKQLEPLQEVEDDLDAWAEELTSEQVQSPTLSRFRDCLESLCAATDGPASADALRALSVLEAEIARAWDEYSAEPFLPDAVSAESVAGHRFLRDGFDCWFDAFDLARARQREEALEAAGEGSRLFRAVALWSDELEADGGQT